jgi:hypothetical protein
MMSFWRDQEKIQFLEISYKSYALNELSCSKLGGFIKFKI